MFRLKVLDHNGRSVFETSSESRKLAIRLFNDCRIATNEAVGLFDGDAGGRYIIIRVRRGVSWVMHDNAVFNDSEGENGG